MPRVATKRKKTTTTHKPRVSRAKTAGKTTKAATAPTKRRATSAKHGGISDEAVTRATGRDWTTWRKLLDAEGATQMKHAEIADIVSRKYNAGPWWSQMVTVGYEQLVGLREKHQTPAGYSVSGSRVIAVPVEQLFAAFEQPMLRRKWLPDAITVRKATPHKSMRIAWTDGTNSVGVNFYSRPGGKSNVQVEHNKLASASAAAKMKAYWSQRLDALRDMLER